MMICEIPDLFSDCDSEVIVTSLGFIVTSQKYEFLYYKIRKPEKEIPVFFLLRYNTCIASEYF